MDGDVAGAEVIEEIGDGDGPGEFAPGLGGMDAAMVVGTGGEDLDPGFAVGGGEALIGGEFLDLRGGEAAEEGPEELAEEGVAEAVEALEMTEEEEEALDMAAGELLIEPVEGMCDGVGEVLGGEIFLEIVDILAEAEDIAVLGFREAPDEEVDLAMILGEPGGDLLGDEDAGEIGDLEAAVDAVVIGDGDEVHAALAKEGVELAWIGVTIGNVEPAQKPLGGAVAEAGVDVEVDLGEQGMEGKL
jgi:hypothetical protein